MLWSALLLVAVVVVVTSLRSIINIPTVAPEIASQQPRSAVPADPPLKLKQQRRQAFFESVVTENLTAAQQANEDATHRCLARIEANFDRYRKT